MLQYPCLQQNNLVERGSADKKSYKNPYHTIDKQNVLRRDCIYENEIVLELGVSCVYLYSSDKVFDTHKCCSLSGSCYAFCINRLKWNDLKVITQRSWYISSSFFCNY